jgi:hypothetical protein
MLAAFYNSLGNMNKCECAYVIYVSLIEEFYEKQSLEAGNAYYLLGIYYSEQGPSLAHKAIACFGRTLFIREKKYMPK